jgi:peptide/nickel transport system permease protein
VNAVGAGWRAYRRTRSGLAGLAILAGYVVVAATAPLFVSAADVSATRTPGPPHRPPSAHFLLGTDGFGRSMLALTMWGARYSLTVGLLATALSVGLGTVCGIVAGQFGGWPGAVLMRVADWFLALPAVVLAAGLAVALGPGAGTTVLAIGLTAWPVTARLVRAEVLVVVAQPHVERARAFGAGDWYVLTRHVFGAITPLVLVQTALAFSGAVLTEATLAFLGLTDATALSWGSTISLARQMGAVSAGEWWILLPPGLAIATVSLAFNLCGRALERVLDPVRRVPA